MGRPLYLDIDIECLLILLNGLLVDSLGILNIRHFEARMINLPLGQTSFLEHQR